MANSRFSLLRILFKPVVDFPLENLTLQKLRSYTVRKWREVAERWHQL